MGQVAGAGLQGGETGKRVQTSGRGWDAVRAARRLRQRPRSQQAFGLGGVWFSGQTCPRLPPARAPQHSFSLAGQVWFSSPSSPPPRGPHGP